MAAPCVEGGVVRARSSSGALWVAALSALAAACESPVVPPPTPFDVCKNLDGLQREVPEGYSRDRDGNCWFLPVIFRVLIDSPAFGDVIARTRALPCRIRILTENLPPGWWAEIDTIFTVNGTVFSCERTSPTAPPELFSGSPATPASLTLPLGEAMVRVEVRYRAGNLIARDSVPIRIRKRPAQFIYETIRHENAHDWRSEFFVTDDDGKGPVKRILADGWKLAWPMLSPDGQTLVWTDFSGPAGCSNLWTGKSDGSEKRMIARGGEHPVFSPNGTKIAYVSDCISWGYSAWVMNRDGSEPKRIAYKPNPYRENMGQPWIAWMPNGEEIITVYDEVFRLDSLFVSRKVIARINIHTNEEKRLYEEETSQSGNHLLLTVHDVSPDGEWVTANTSNSSSLANRGRIAILRTDGSRELRWLTAVGGTGGVGTGDRLPFWCGEDFLLICFTPSVIMFGPNIRAVDREGRNIQGIYRHTATPVTDVATRRWAWQRVWF